MPASDAAAPAALAFLSVVEHAEFGWMGGCLLLNARSRPLEFLCTAPLKPTRTQEILYGPTLAPYLCGEQIAGSLLAQARTRPRFVCTDCGPVLAVRALAETPVVWLRPAEAERAARAEAPLLRSSPPGLTLREFPLGELLAAVDAGARGDEAAIVERWREDFGQCELWEPFARIREALAEAQRSLKPASQAA